MFHCKCMKMNILFFIRILPNSITSIFYEFQIFCTNLQRNLLKFV